MLLIYMLAVDAGGVSGESVCCTTEWCAICDNIAEKVLFLSCTEFLSSVRLKVSFYKFVFA